MNSAQGSLEYLLLIGGAVVVASVVTVFLLGTSSTAGQAAINSADSIEEKKAELGFVSVSPGLAGPNSNFESGQSGWVNGASGTSGVTTSQHYSGSSSWQIINSTSFCNNYVYQEIDVLPNTTYIVSGYVKTININSGSGSANDGAAVFASQSSNATPGCSTWAGMVNSSPITGTNNWAKYTSTTFNSGSCTKARFGFALFWCWDPAPYPNWATYGGTSWYTAQGQYASPSGEAYYDDLSVEQAS